MVFGVVAEPEHRFEPAYVGSTLVQGASPPLPPPLAPGAASTSRPAVRSNHSSTLTVQAPSGGGNNGDLGSSLAKRTERGIKGAQGPWSISVDTGLPVSPRPNSRSSSSSGRQEPAPLILPQQALMGPRAELDEVTVSESHDGQAPSGSWAESWLRCLWDLSSAQRYGTNTPRILPTRTIDVLLRTHTQRGEQLCW